MNGGIGGGSLGQRSSTGSARVASANAGGGTGQQGGSPAEMSQFMQIVGQMMLQQAAMTGSSLIANMQPDDAGDE